MQNDSRVAFRLMIMIHVGSYTNDWRDGQHCPGRDQSQLHDARR